MADAAGNAPAQQGEQQQNGGGTWSAIIRALLMYMVFSNFMGARKPPPSPTDLAQQPDAAVSLPSGGMPQVGASATIRPAWGPRQQFDVRMYVSETETFDDFANKDALIWEEEGLVSLLP